MAPISSDDRGPLLNVVMWIVLVPVCITAVLKPYIKWDMIRKLQADDFLMIIALLAAVGQCVATSEQVQHGLGKHQSDLTSEQIDSFYLMQYVAQIMYLFATFVPKLLGLYFFICLTGHDRSWKRAAIYSTMLFTGIWTSLAFFLAVFQCHFPHPWLSGHNRCIDQRGFWTANAIVDGITQVIVGLFPIYLLYGLNMEKPKKILAMFSFSPNIITLPFIVWRLALLFNSFYSTDYTWDSFNLALVTNIHASTSIIAAGIPFSKSVIDSLVLAPHLIKDDATLSALMLDRQNTRGYLVRSKSKSGRSAGPKNSSKWTQSTRAWNVTEITSNVMDGEELRDFATHDRSQEKIIRQTRSTTITSTTVAV